MVQTHSVDNQLNVHIYPSTFINESRIIKICGTLRDHHVFSDVMVIALWKIGLPREEKLGCGLRVVRIAPLFGGSLPGILGKIVKAISWYVAVLNALRGQAISCFNCHSLPVLPLSVGIKFWKKCALIYDTHELETETATSKGGRKMLMRLVERVFIGSADAVSVVNRSIADWYAKAYALKRVYVVKNVPVRTETPLVRTGLLRRAIGLNPLDAQLFIYQGLLSKGRGIELLIQVFSDLSKDRHIVFMGYGELEGTIRRVSQSNPNIHFLAAVPPERVKDYTVDADVGLSLIENVCLSYYLCLPNKLFEYAACGVPSIVSSFPEMGRFIDEFECGWKCVPEHMALKVLIESITPSELAGKRANTENARSRNDWQGEVPTLLALYQSLGFLTRDLNGSGHTSPSGLL